MDFTGLSWGMQLEKNEKGREEEFGEVFWWVDWILWGRWMRKCREEKG